MLLAYEVTRDLPLQKVTVETPVCRTEAPLLSGKKLALVSIMRANGLLDILELIPAGVGFVGLYRMRKRSNRSSIGKVPDKLEDRLVIAVDPMLATGNSSVAAITRLKEAGARDVRLLVYWPHQREWRA